MRVGQYIYGADGWTIVAGEDTSAPALILVFASPDLADTTAALETLRDRCQHAHIVGCTTGGEILGDDLLDGYITATSIEFEKSRVHVHHCGLSDRRESFGVGRRIAAALDAPDLRGIMVLSDGLDTNGVMLVRGLRDGLQKEVPVFGGLAADGTDFVVTRVMGNGPIHSGSISAVGFYGADLQIRNAVGSGWQPTGAGLPVTNYSGSIIYEIAGRQARDVFVEQTGLAPDPAPGQFLKYPLWMYEADKPELGVVRAVIGVDDKRGSLIVAGDVPANAMFRPIASCPQMLIDAAVDATSNIAEVPRNSLSLVVSCLGRRIALGDKKAAEIEAISAALGSTYQAGFYAYGEFGRHPGAAQNDFFNHSISISVIWERL